MIEVVPENTIGYAPIDEAIVKSVYNWRFYTVLDEEGKPKITIVGTGINIIGY